MTNKKITLQIFTGGFNENTVSFEDFQDKLLLLINNVKVDKVIMGWAINEEIYYKTKNLLKKYNIDLYLWMPVFSEIGLLNDCITSKDYRGEEIKNYNLQEGENFEFYCPTNKKNLLNFYSIYEKHFKHIGFDGVFLDKIRYGSFSNGINGVLTCFCNDCLEVYKQKGLDLEVLKKEIRLLEDGRGNYNKIPFNIVEYKDGKYNFENDIWDKFFSIKSEIILDRLTEIKDYFYNQGMKVGIDTFAPFIAYFIGQDLEKMQELVDFNKTMMYRITQAPAGLPFELDCLIKESTKGDFYNIRKRFLNIVGIKDYENKVPIEFVKKELQTLSNESKCHIYCGIEINRKKHIAEVYPDYIKENLINLDNTNFEGYVLSWDLVSAPIENIQTVVEILG